MAFVLDTSVSACWALADENHPVADEAFSRLRTQEAVVPALWWFEIRNLLVVSERRGRITQRDTDFFLQALAQFRVRVDRTPKEGDVLAMARKHNLSVYDAAYLELAHREELPIATLDRRLAEAARLMNVRLIESAG